MGAAKNRKQKKKWNFLSAIILFSVDPRVAAAAKGRASYEESENFYYVYKFSNEK